MIHLTKPIKKDKIEQNFRAEFSNFPFTCLDWLRGLREALQA